MERALISTQALAGIETTKVSGMTGEQILSHSARIAVVGDTARSRIHLDRRSGDIA